MRGSLTAHTTNCSGFGPGTRVSFPCETTAFLAGNLKALTPGSSFTPTVHKMERSGAPVCKEWFKPDAAWCATFKRILSQAEGCYERSHFHESLLGGSIGLQKTGLSVPTLVGSVLPDLARWGPPSPPPLPPTPSTARRVSNVVITLCLCPVPPAAGACGGRTGKRSPPSHWGVLAAGGDPHSQGLRCSPHL